MSRKMYHHSSSNKSGRSQHVFSQIPRAETQRSSFNRSFNHKTSFDGGWLIPLWADEALPGDTINMKLTALVRLPSALVHPVMDNIFLDFFFFFVPNRLIWDNWAKFCGEQTDPGDSIAYTIPQMTTNPTEADLHSYLGIPIQGGNITFNCLHHRAYNLIWNEWFRSEDLQNSATVDTDNGPDTPADYVLLRRGKRHDYFTSCLPFMQKGTPVELPLGTTAPVIPESGTAQPLFDMNGTLGIGLRSDTSGDNARFDTTMGSTYSTYWDDPQLVADLATATAATINQIREAFQIQRLLERDARGGTRYTEIIRSHFNVTSPDQRLQRPEYLGGGSTRLDIASVPSTVTGTEGTLGAFGVAAEGGIGFNRSFTEHGVLLGLVNARADLTYQQGLPRMFTRQTRYDYYWPALAHLGEQSVLNSEVFYTGTPATDDATFGYQERWAEYRYKPSIVSGSLNSEASTPLDSWHLGMDFASVPTLNSTFIEDDPPIDRVIRTPGEHHFVGDFHFNFRHVRPMPTYSVPGLVDHF